MRFGSGSARVVAFLLLVLALQPAIRPAAAGPAETFDTLATTFLEGYYGFRPVQATRDGVHDHDALLAGFTRAEVDAELTRLREAQAAVAPLKGASLDTTRRIDHAILTATIEAEILELETVRRWQRDPSYYVDLVTGGVHSLALRSSAPPEQRLRSIIARERLIGSVLAAALENLSNPPRAWTEVAIERATGAAVYLESTLPGYFKAVSDTALLSEFRTANLAAVRDMQSFASYLREDLLPVSRGDFRLGAAGLEKKMVNEEMCDVPLYRLEKYGEEEITRLELEIRNAATGISPDKPLKDVLRMLSVDHPDPRRLVAEAGKSPASLRRFCAENELLTIPAKDQVQVLLTPEFLRGDILMAPDLPGGFETGGREAFQYVTPPVESLDWQKKDDHMRALNRYAVDLHFMSDLYPGQYVRSLRNGELKTPVRKALGCSSLSLGWGLYAGRMMLEQGYGSSDPAYRLFQRMQALLHACRYLVALRMHGGQMTPEEATTYLAQHVWLDPAQAAREVRLIVLDPMPAIAAQLGKLQILKLREDYRRHRGTAFTLREFHDRLLGLGRPPLKLLRQTMMPGDKGTVL